MVDMLTLIDGPGVAANKPVETRWKQAHAPFLAQPTDHVTAASRPQVLEHLFVCVTFHWDVSSLTLLRQVEEYPRRRPPRTPQ